MTESVTRRRREMPFCRVEVAVLSLIDERLQVLLAKRAEAPHAGRWALPGGVLRIDSDRSLDDAANRVIRERLKIDPPFLRQLCAVGGKERDDRAPWALSVVYRALAPAEQIRPQPGKRVEALRWWPIEDVAVEANVAFDHRELVAKAAAATREELDRLELPAGFLPDHFTLGELQATCEQLLGRRLDKSSFRRRLADRDLVEPVPGEVRGGAFRPAQVYRIRAD